MLAWRPRYRQWIRTLKPKPAPRQIVWDEALPPRDELDTQLTRWDQAIPTAMITHPLHSLMAAL